MGTPNLHEHRTPNLHGCWSVSFLFFLRFSFGAQALTLGDGHGGDQSQPT